MGIYTGSGTIFMQRYIQPKRKGTLRGTGLRNRRRLMYLSSGRFERIQIGIISGTHFSFAPLEVPNAKIEGRDR